MRRKKEVTMQAIADELEISKVTVSKALNDKEGVSDELKLKIKQIAEAMGYKKSNIDATEENESPKYIGIMVKEKYVNSEERVTFYLKFYQKLASQLNAKGYMCNLFTLKSEGKQERELPKLFLETPIHGVIVIGNIHKEYISAIRGLDIPMVFLDFYDSDNNIDCVLTDNYYSAYEITNYLVKNGHEKIGFVGNINATSSIQDRFLGYYRSLLEAKLEIRTHWVISDRDEEGEAIAFILPQEMPTAFVCNCDDTAYKFINHLKKQGYKVPDEISIVGFDNDIYAEVCEPKLTTLAVDVETMTQKASTLMISKVEEEVTVKSTRIFVTGDIIYRNSVKKIN
ncbi:MAG: LacI family DNA-binding transcriptional regulator [Cellulosilyticaceae bacterium]